MAQRVQYPVLSAGAADFTLGIGTAGGRLLKVYSRERYSPPPLYLGKGTEPWPSTKRRRGRPQVYERPISPPLARMPRRRRPAREAGERALRRAASRRRVAWYGYFLTVLIDDAGRMVLPRAADTGRTRFRRATTTLSRSSSSAPRRAARQRPSRSTCGARSIAVVVVKRAHTGQRVGSHLRATFLCMSMCAYLKLSVRYNGLTGTAPPGVGSTHLAQVIHSTDLTELPETLTTLGTRAFFSCRSLLLTALPPTVTAIGNGAFEHCTSLALTALPPNPTSIGDGTFRGCTSLLLTELPPILTTIGDSAFLGCTSLLLTEL